MSTLLFAAACALLLATAAANQLKLINLSIFAPNCSAVVFWHLILFYLVLLAYSIEPSLFESATKVQEGMPFNFPWYEDRFVLLSCCGCFPLIAGYALGKRAGWKRQSLSQWYESKLSKTPLTDFAEKGFVPVLVLSLAAAGIYVQMIGGLSELPLYVLLSGRGYLDIVWSREDATKLIPLYVAYPLQLLRLFVFPALASYAYVSARLHRRSAKKWARFAFALAACVTFNASSTALGPVAIIIVQLCLCEVMLQRRRVRRLMAVYAASLVSVLALLFALNAIWPDEELSFLEVSQKVIYDKLLLRGYDILSSISYFAYFYPDAQGRYLGPAGHPKLAYLFGVEYHSIGNELFTALHPSMRVYTGTLNGPWFLYDYAMFGLLGATLSSLILGFILGKIDLLFSTMPKDPVVVALLAFSLSTCLYVFDAPVSTWMFSHGGILGGLALIALSALSRPKASQAGSGPPDDADQVRVVTWRRHC